MVNIDYHCYHFYWKYKDQWSQSQKKKVKGNWSHSIILLIFIFITLNLNPSSSTRFPRDPRPPILPAFILFKVENDNQTNVLLLIKGSFMVTKNLCQGSFGGELKSKSYIILTPDFLRERTNFVMWAMNPFWICKDRTPCKNTPKPTWL